MLTNLRKAGVSLQTFTPILAPILSLAESVLVGSSLQIFGSAGLTVCEGMEYCASGADSNFLPPDHVSDELECIFLTRLWA